MGSLKSLSLSVELSQGDHIGPRYVPIKTSQLSKTLFYPFSRSNDHPRNHFCGTLYSFTLQMGSLKSLSLSVELSQGDHIGPRYVPIKTSKLSKTLFYPFSRPNYHPRNHF